MLFMKILGILIAIAGIAALLFSNYIDDQVLQGKTKIAQGERAVKKGNQLFSGNPVSEQIGKGLTSGANKKIAKGKEEIAYYEDLSSKLKTGGTVAIIVGAGIFIFSFFRKKKRR